MRGSITVESAIVIPIVLVICGGLILFGWHYCQAVVASSQALLAEDVYVITGFNQEVHSDFNDEEHIVNLKTVVRIIDALDDLTDSIAMTKNVKVSYQEAVQRIADKISDF